MVVSPDGTQTYVTNSGEDTLSGYRSADLEPLGQVELSSGPHGLRPTADGTTLVIANTAEGTIDVVDTATLSVTATIPVGDSPVQVAVAGDGQYAYVSLAGDSAVAKVDLASRAVVATVEVPTAPVQLYLTTDGAKLLSADQGTNDDPGDTVSVIDPADMSLTASIETGAGPHGVVIDPTGTLAWVTNLYDDTVSVLDLTTNEAVATIPVGDKPNGISFSPQAPSWSAPKTVEITVPDYADSSETTDGHAEDGEKHD